MTSLAESARSMTLHGCLVRLEDRLTQVMQKHIGDLLVCNAHQTITGGKDGEHPPCTKAIKKITEDWRLV